MTRIFLPVFVILAAMPAGGAAQEVSTEYRVKAAFLYNFVKFVEWPPGSSTGPIDICVAGQNPFNGVLTEIVRDEMIAGRPIHSRVILEPDPACDVIFVPRGANTPPYLRAVRGMPVLTVGETSNFIAQGGVVRFFLEETKVRFEINRGAAERAGLRLSSRLLQLARITPDGGATP